MAEAKTARMVISKDGPYVTLVFCIFLVSGLANSLACHRCAAACSLSEL